MLFKTILIAFVGALLVNEGVFARPDDQPQTEDAGVIDNSSENSPNEDIGSNSSDDEEQVFVASPDGGDKQVIVPAEENDTKEDEPQSSSEVKPDNQQAEDTNKTEQESVNNENQSNSQDSQVNEESDSKPDTKKPEDQKADEEVPNVDGGKADEEQVPQTNDQQNNTKPNVEDNDHQSSNACPRGWFSLDGLSKCYYIITSYQSWNDSLAMCTTIGGSLASVHSIVEAKFLEAKLNDSAWIGLNDNITDGVYMWSDETPFDFKRWGEGEPSLFYKVQFFFTWTSSREDCVEMQKPKLFKWNDEICSSKRQAICSRKPERIPRTACPEGWTSDGNKSCYKLSSNKANYKTASEICSLVAVEGTLAAPSNEGENEFLANMMKVKNISTIWIGVNDIKEEKKFQTNEGKVQTFFKWNPKQPSETSSWFSFNEDGVQMDKTGKWNDENCDATSNFVCKITVI